MKLASASRGENNDDIVVKDVRTRGVLVRLVGYCIQSAVRVLYPSLCFIFSK